MNALAEKQCVACSGHAELIKGGTLVNLAAQLEPGWRVVNEHHLDRELEFRDFRCALDFTNQVGALAEAQGHHPDIYLSWGKVRLLLWTHSVDGLTENDFILASKIDALPQTDSLKQAPLAA